MKTTTIAISETTKTLLNSMASKGVTYDEIVRNLIEIAQKSMFFNKQKRILGADKFVRIEDI